MNLNLRISKKTKAALIKENRRQEDKYPDKKSREYDYITLMEEAVLAKYGKEEL